MESINEYLEGFEFQSNWRHIHWMRSIFVGAAKHRYFGKLAGMNFWRGQ
jgi:hypothetical protein